MSAATGPLRHAGLALDGAALHREDLRGVTQLSAPTGAMPRRTGFAALAMNPTLAPHHRPGRCVAF